MTYEEEPWKLSEKQKMMAEQMGLTEEAIEKLEQRREKEYKRLHTKSLEEMDLTEEEFQNYFEDKYGIEHVCHCLEDRFSGDMVVGTSCEIEIKEKALDRLEELNEAMAGQQDDIESLRAQLITLGEEPVA